MPLPEPIALPAPNDDTPPAPNPRLELPPIYDMPPDSGDRLNDVRIDPIADDPRAWKALQNFAKRADVGLRMELIGWMSRSDGRKKQQVAFLAPFLDDPEVRDPAANPDTRSP